MELANLINNWKKSISVGQRFKCKRHKIRESPTRDFLRFSYKRSNKITSWPGSREEFFRQK